MCCALCCSDLECVPGKVAWPCTRRASPDVLRSCSSAALGCSGGAQLLAGDAELVLHLLLLSLSLQVWEEHQVLLKQDGGWVAQHICTNDAPKGDCFRAMVQLVGVYVSSGKSRLRVSLKVGCACTTLCFCGCCGAGAASLAKH